jgi:hypothetical protein
LTIFPPSLNLYCCLLAEFIGGHTDASVSVEHPIRAACVLLENYS